MRKTIILATSLFLVLSMAACNTAAKVNLPDATETSPAAPAKGTVPESSSAAPASAAAPAAEPQSATGDLQSLQSAYEQIYEKVLPSVVSIEVTATVTQTTPSLPEFPFGFNLPQDNGQDQQQYQESGAGSGFVWDTEGHIVTNNHVVDGMDTIQVRFSDGTNAPATVVGKDASSDLAVVKVDLPASQLTPITVADSTKVKVGQLVVAIGNPFRLNSSMSTGIVSGLGRSLPLDSTSGSTSTYTIPDVIQTDAAINPGNSGGVLADIDGQLIGVTSAIESPVRANSGVGYVIPSIIVQKIVPFLIKDGSYKQPYIGITGMDMNAEIAQAMKLDASTRGALIIDVTPATPAEKAGFKGSDKTVKIDGQDLRIGGDVITSIDGNTIKDFEDLTAYLARYTNVGQTINITYLRDGKESQASLTLAARPTTQESSASTSSETGKGAWLGISGTTMSDEIATAMGLNNTPAGVLVQQIQSGSPADKAGLLGSYKPYDLNGEQVLIGGDIITAVDNTSVASMNDLASAISSHKPGDTISLSIIREGKESKLSVTLAERPG
jgi:serine protease Do